jgi:hypothetical protein
MINTRFSAYLVTDYFLLAASLCLLLFNLLNLHTIGNIFLTVISSSIIPGYVFLRLLNIRHLHSHLEIATLSFALSFPLTSLLSFFLSPMSEHAKIISAAFVILSLSPIIRDKFEGSKLGSAKAVSQEGLDHGMSIPRILLLGLMVAFFGVIISKFYPQISWDAGADVARHYSSALLFSKFSFPLTSLSPFFVSFEAMVIELSYVSMEIVKQCLGYLSIMVIISFYTMAVVFFKKIDDRLSMIATIMWFVFSGFGWLYFLQEKLSLTSVSQTSLLYLTRDKSYADIGYGISTNLWIWFLPMTVSFTLFFTLVYLMKRTDLPQNSFVSVFSMIIMALVFVHVPELVMFVVLLIALSIFSPKIELRLRDSLLSTIIGLGMGLALASIFLTIGLSFGYSYILIFGLIILTFFGYALQVTRHNKSNFGGFLKIINVSEVVKVVIAAFLILFSGGLLAWFSSTVDFSMKYVSEIQFIPWLLYPVRLGIVGALGLVGIVVGVKHRRSPFVLFVLLLFSSLLIGRIVSLLNLYVETGYWEWRFLFFIFAAASILGALTIGRNRSTISKNLRPKKLIFSTSLLGLLIISGFSSTFLTFDFYSLTFPEPPSNQTAEALSFFSNLLDHGIVPSLITSPQSTMSSLIPNSYSYSNLLPAIWYSKYSEIPLSIIYNQESPNSYIYLSNMDIQTLKEINPNGYMVQYGLERFPEVFNNSKARIYTLLDGVPPTSNSQTVLVVPSEDEIDKNHFLLYDTLSLGGYNYTAMLDSDPSIFKAGTVIVADDKSINAINNILDHLKTSNGKRLIVFNTDGYGPLSEYFFKGNTQIDLGINSTAKDLYLHPTSNYVVASTILNETPPDNNFEFIIDNDIEENNATIIADDMQTQFWNVQLKSDSSKISLLDDSSVKAKGADSLQQIWNMSAQDWGKIYHAWASDQDWSNKGFLCFYYKGSNTGKRIEVGIYAPDALNMHRWTFTDNFTDWRRFVFPLNESSEGWQIGNPDLARVRQIEFFVPPTGGHSLNYTWHLDRVLTDTGRRVDFEISLKDKYAFKGLECFDGAKYVTVPYSINASQEILGDRLYYLDGQDAGELFGNESSASVYTTEGNNDIRMFLTLKMPPDDGRDSESYGLSQSKFRIELAKEVFNATQISGEKGMIELPTQFEVSAISTKDDVNVLSSYTNGQTNSPFVVKTVIGESEVIYVNIYPLNEAMLSSDVAKRSLYSVLGSLLELANIKLQKYDDAVVPWIMNDDVPFLIFRNANLTGNINVSSTSVIFPEKLSFERIEIKTDMRELSLENVTSLEIRRGDNMNIFAHQARISNGKGFYPLLVVASPEIAITGSNVDIAVKLANGSIIEVNNEPMANLSIAGSVNVYVRTPFVQNDGEADFEEAYSLHSYYSEFRTLGENLHIEGSAKFSVPLSDTYSFATEFAYNGSAERQPPLLQWDEWKSIENSAIWLVISSSFFVALFLTSRYLSVKIEVHIKRKAKYSS